MKETNEICPQCFKNLYKLKKGINKNTKFFCRECKQTFTYKLKS
jgi:transposase-like protein